jgi:DNA-binding NarL/FixJ family response regulator
MAFREVTMLEVKEVLRLWLLGVPKKRIAQQLGFDVKTVRRYLGVAKRHGVDQAHGLAALDAHSTSALPTRVGMDRPTRAQR